MNFISQSKVLWQLPLCRNCALRVVGRNGPPVTASYKPHISHSEDRQYHNIRLETVQEAWAQLKKEFKFLKRASANLSPDPKDFALGQEIGTAIFLIKAKAAVHFSNGVWYGKNRESGKISWPHKEAVGYTVNAVDAKETLLDRNGFEDLVKLKDIKYLNLEGCPYVDDHCLASLVHIRGSLTHLNVNRCSNITENGLATLHKLRKLEKLNMNDVPKVKYPKLVAAMLEEALPNLRVNIISQLVEKKMKRRERKEAAEDILSQRMDSDLGQKQSVS